MPRVHPAAATGFELGVGDYERGRPGYPPEAVRVLCEALRLAPGRTVLDLAAGTGKLTRELVKTGADVIAVEPVRAMRETLAAALASVRVLDGTAEALPVPDASVDAVAVAQAFHWFDGDRALAEIRRALRPRGRLGLVWNKRRETDPLQRAITTLVEPYRAGVPGHTSLAWKEAFARTSFFTPLEEWHVSWRQTTDVDGVVARVTSISFIAALPDGERARVAARARDLVAGDERVELAYDTHLYSCERR
jgi:SAM-dependent methyltransferase